MAATWRLGRERRRGRGSVWVSLAGHLLMGIGSAEVTDGPGPLAALLFSGGTDEDAGTATAGRTPSPRPL
ncbi:MAG: hypothetical protein JWR66_2375 [Modestobacter sp.]|jgi:hypothetical protein|nr:hypothetical protein [Modestobacter sp.]